MLKFLVQFWMNLLMPSFFGIGTGPSNEEKQMGKFFTDLSTYGTQQGKTDIGQAENFWSDILSGDMNRISQVLGPEFSAINKQAQQRKKTTAEFGNRGGGNNAIMQSLDDNTRAAINGMISDLTGKSATALTGIGENLLSTGVNAGGEAFSIDKTLHDQNEAKWKDIFNSISSILGAVGGMPGMAGTTTGGVLTSAAGAL